MAAKKINIGVAGVGFMGATHLRIYQRVRGVRIAAVCDVSGRIKNGVLGGVAGNIQQTDALRFRTETRVVRTFEALLEDPAIDVIDICTPTALHPAQAIAALRAGKHVICEKPLATTSAEARQVAKAAAQARGFLMVAMGVRFWPGWSLLKEVVSEETYGTVLAASFRRLSSRPTWGAGASHPGGALLDLHIHDTDFVNYVFGRPAAVFCSGVLGGSGAVDHVATQYIYPGGSAVQAEGTWLLHGGFNMAYTVYAEGVTLDYDFQRGAEALRVTRAGKASQTMKLRGEDGYNVELRHFIDCIREGRPSPVVSAADAVACLEICEAEEKSARTGKIVSL
jgi:predicted dehydrogenase